MTLTANEIQFARETADPNFSLSVPEGAKITIRKLLAEVESLTACNDEAEEKLAALDAGVLNLSHDDLVRRVTEVGPARFKRDVWLSARLSAARIEGAEATVGAFVEIQDRLTDSHGFAEADRIRFALQHLTALREGQATTVPKWVPALAIPTTEGTGQ